jgi:hypothetical protein
MSEAALATVTNSFSVILPKVRIAQNKTAAISEEEQ